VSFVFRHPNYYKQLKEERRRYERQAASSDPDTPQGVGPGAGLPDPSSKRQAASIKRQAASVNAEIYNDTDYKATSIKRQALTEIPDN
jgi:hypothetical protein